MNYKIKKLKDVADFIRGITYKPNELVDNFSNNSVVCMRTANIQTILEQRDLLSVPKELIKNSDKFLEEGDILVSTANSWNLVGKCCWVPKLSYPATAGGFISILRAKESINKRFLYHWFNSENIQRKARDCGRQTTNISNMDINRSLEIEISLPDLPTQTKIAQILDKADQIRQKRKKAIELADEFLRSLFLEMFGDPVVNRNGWEVKKLIDICKKITDGTHHSPPIEKSGIPYITAKHLKNSGLRFFEDPWYISEENHKSIYARCNPEIGDVLYIKDGATTGIAAVNYYEFEFSMLSSLALLKVDKSKIIPEYLAFLLNIQSIKNKILSNVAGAAITRLTLAKIKEIKLPIPPIDTQQKFVDIYLKISNLKNKIETSKTDELFNSLSQQYFAKVE